MTTYALLNGLLAADTCLSSTMDGRTQPVGRANKIAAGPLRASTGAGACLVVSSLLFLPNLLALRWLGWALVPNYAALEEGSAHSVVVVWRHGPVWHLAARLERRRGVLFARCTKAFLSHAHHQPFALGGSGLDHIGADDLERLGCAGAIALAAARCPATNDEIVAFDTRAWAFTAPVARFPPLHPTLLDACQDLARRADRRLRGLRPLF